MLWAEHVARMGDKRIPKQFFYAEVKTGKPRKRFNDNLNELHMDVHSLEKIYFKPYRVKVYYKV